MQSGARVEATYKGNKYTGILMPSTEKGLIILKLDNGYNIGLKGAKIKKIGVAKALKTPKFKVKSKKKLPTVTIITTGGTITSRVDYRTGAVHSLSKAEELLASIPEIAKLANIRVLNPFNIMSEDMNHTHWQKLAKLIANDKSEGVIVTHGTDTLHFTSAALSFMLNNLNKPVALVGGQRSSDRGSFDGAQNLICAIHYCLSDIAEVAIVMHGTTEDESCIAIRGTKARKMHTSRRDAFRPINDLPLAQIYPNGKIKLIQKYNKRSSSKVKANTKFEPKIALVKFAPGLDPGLIDYYVKKKYKGIILEGTGLGHVSVKSWLKSIKSAAKKMFVGMTSQCLYGRVDPFVYTNMRILKDAGVVYLEDMLPETAYVKLGWALANKKSMQDNLVGEISKRIPKKAYLY